jgi:hypothetical protein
MALGPPYATLQRYACTATFLDVYVVCETTCQTNRVLNHERFDA